VVQHAILDALLEYRGKPVLVNIKVHDEIYTGYVTRVTSTRNPKVKIVVELARMEAIDLELSLTLPPSLEWSRRGDQQLILILFQDRASDPLSADAEACVAGASSILYTLR